MTKKPTRIIVKKSSIESTAQYQLSRAVNGEQTRISDPCVLHRVLELAKEQNITVELCAYWPVGDVSQKRDTPLRKVTAVEVAFELGGTVKGWTALL